MFSLNSFNSNNQNPPHTVIRKVTNPYKWAFYVSTIVWIFSLVLGVGYHNHTLESLKKAKASGIEVDQLLQLTNNYRVKHGSGKLTINPVITQAAQAKAEDMLRNQYFAHYRPSDNKRGISFIKDFGYDYQIAGENLAVHYETSEDVVNGWQNSSLHRQNLLNSEFQEVGFGVASGEFEGYTTFFVVQFLAKSQPIETNSASSNAPISNPASSNTTNPVDPSVPSNSSSGKEQNSTTQDYPEAERMPIAPSKNQSNLENSCPCTNDTANK